MNTLAETVTARRDHLVASARCPSCHLTRAECLADVEPGVPLGCCPDCAHPVSINGMDTLLAEAAAGEVRTVEEVDPPPIQGPKPVTMHWLLHQRVWWQPRRGPMIKIHHMTDTHRLHAIRMLDRQAARIALYENMIESAWLSHPLGPSGDMARDAFEHELNRMLCEPIEWLHETPLLRSLAAILPVAHVKQDRKHVKRAWANLEERAEHWSACPANRNLTDPCRCRVGHPDDPEVGPPVDRARFDEVSGRGVL